MFLGMSEKMTEEVAGALEDDLRDKKEVRVKDEDLKNTLTLLKHIIT